MIARRFLPAFAACSLAGCSFLGEQQPLGNAYAPPSGWKEFPIPFKVAINPVLGVWTRGDAKSADLDEFITVLRLPANSKINLDDQLKSTSGASNGEIVSRKSVHLCGGLTGTEVQLKGTATTGGKTRHLIIVSVVGQGKNQTLVAAYSRQESMAADAAAIASLEKLCPNV